MGKDPVMKTPCRLLLVALLGVGLASCSNTAKENASSTATTSSSGAPTEAAPVARGEAAAIQVAFSVESVDAAKRLITLKGPEGNVGEYSVGEQVQRLAEIKPGDKINAEYKVAAVA